eukprot:gene35371-40011_t
MRVKRGALAVVLALLFPGELRPHAGSRWAPIHWVLGIASYGLFAAAVVHAWLTTRAEKQIRLATEPQGGVPLLTLERLTFRFVTAGFVLLSATLLAGLLFSEQLYGAAGRAWKWDHKSAFSVLAWISFAVLLIGRARFGWRGRTARRVLYAGSALLLLAFASPRALVIAFLPVATGVVIGTAAVSWVFGSVHGLTLGFGSTLIGETVDYAIYYLIQARGAAVPGTGWQRWRTVHWPTVRIGLLTS